MASCEVSEVDGNIKQWIILGLGLSEWTPDYSSYLQCRCRIFKHGQRCMVVLSADYPDSGSVGDRPERLVTGADFQPATKLLWRPLHYMKLCECSRSLKNSSLRTASITIMKSCGVHHLLEIIGLLVWTLHIMTVITSRNQEEYVWPPTGNMGLFQKIGNKKTLRTML